MSSYTYVILTCSHIDEIGEYGITMLLPALAERCLPPLARAEEIPVYTACANYLPLAKIVEAIESVPWQYPKEVQLFHKHEDAERYEEADLKLKRLKRDFHMEWTSDENGTQFDEFTQTHGDWATHCHTEVKEPR